MGKRQVKTTKLLHTISIVISILLLPISLHAALSEETPYYAVGSDFITGEGVKGSNTPE